MRAGSNIGLTSAPRCPQAGHVNFGSKSDSRTSSGHRSALIAIEWCCGDSLRNRSTGRARLTSAFPRWVFAARQRVAGRSCQLGHDIHGPGAPLSVV
jgi:hypothetical protein